MDIFFVNPDDTPVPPEEMEIRKLDVQPYEDKRRVKISFEISPFLQRPNIEISVKNEQGVEVSQLSVVEAIENNMDFTLHLREKNPGGSYTMEMQIFYTDLSGLEDEDMPPIRDMVLNNKNIVASKQITFKSPD